MWEDGLASFEHALEKVRAEHSANRIRAEAI
jgi:hypothetical protein